MKSTPGGSESKLWPVVRVATGNFLEMYDFMVFGYYAAAIGTTFFPGGSEFASLMKSLMTFGAGYLMRPLGAILLGSYIDRCGRRKGLLLTLSLMAVGTVSIACTPSYRTIGLLLVLRRSLSETDSFLARRRPARSEIFQSIGANWRLIGLGMMLSTMTTVCFYMITAYTPTFGSIVLHLDNTGVQIVILCTG